MRVVALAAVAALLFPAVVHAQDAGLSDAGPLDEPVVPSAEIVREYPVAPSEQRPMPTAPPFTSVPVVPYPYAPGHGPGGLLDLRSYSGAGEAHTTIQSDAALGAGVIMAILAIPAAIVGTLMMISGSPQVGCTGECPDSSEADTGLALVVASPLLVMAATALIVFGAQPVASESAAPAAVPTVAAGPSGIVARWTY